MKQFNSMKKKMDQHAVTEIFGTLLLLLIAVSLFSVLYFFVFTFDAPEQPDSVSIIGYANGTNVTIAHWGGPALDPNNIIITLNNNEKQFRLVEEDNDNLWGIGETLNVSTPPGNEFLVNVIDTNSNSLLMIGSVTKS